MAAFYTDFDKVDHRTRVLAYLKAMEGVAQSYPNDDEAQILYAIELNVAAPPSDKTYAMQLKGAAILEPIFGHGLICPRSIDHCHDQKETTIMSHRRR